MLRNILPLFLAVALIAIGIFYQAKSLSSALAFVAGALFAKSLDIAISTYLAKRLTLYIGNLPYKAHENAVRDLFLQYGEIYSLRLVKDRFTGKKKGFGFIEMPIRDAKRALKKLNDSIFQERTLIVRIAKSQDEKESS